MPAPPIGETEAAQWLAKRGGPLRTHAAGSLRVELQRCDDRWHRATVRDRLCELRAEVAALGARCALTAATLDRRPDDERERIDAVLRAFADQLGAAHATMTAELRRVDRKHDEIGEALAAYEDADELAATA